MNIKNLENVVNGIVENEFNHVQDTLALDFEKENTEYKQAVLMTESIREALKKHATEEQQKLIGELEDSIGDEWRELCQFYFREGLRTGLCNLKFLNEVYGIGTIL